MMAFQNKKHVPNHQPGGEWMANGGELVTNNLCLIDG